MKKQAALFVYVWPEPRSSAAGVRTLALCHDLAALGYDLTVFSPCKTNEASQEMANLNINTVPCPANDSTVEAFLKEKSPDLVIFDRFVMEEQFGWRARELWPKALHLVDTQDLHTVRRARERLADLGSSPEDILELKNAELSPDLERELASLYRADGCFVVSSWERDWLVALNYPADRVCCLPFGATAEIESPPFENRRGFAFLGNFRHGPNLDAVRFLATELWPSIASRLPEEKLHLYGAYPPASVSQLNGKGRIVMEGPVENHRAALMRHRVLLAPLRFGAGIKGKVLESWASGTPVVGTAIAMEGLAPELSIKVRDFVEQAELLHRDKNAWQKAQTSGLAALQNFDPAVLRSRLESFLTLGFESQEKWRNGITGRMLRHHQQNSTKYFSRWIEEKNKK